MGTAVLMFGLKVLSLVTIGAIVVEVALIAWRSSGAWWLVAVAAAISFLGFISSAFLGTKDIWLLRLFRIAYDTAFASTWLALEATVLCLCLAVMGGIFVTQKLAYELALEKEFTIQTIRGPGSQLLDPVQILVQRIWPDSTEPKLLKTEDGRASYPASLHQVLQVWVRAVRHGQLQDGAVGYRRIETLPDFMQVKADDIANENWADATPGTPPQGGQSRFVTTLVYPAFFNFDRPNVNEVDARQHAPWGLPKAPLVLNRKAYSVGYDPTNKIPRWVAYQVFAQPKETKRSHASVYADPALPTDSQALDQDYIGSGLGRGHLVSPQDVEALGDEAVQTTWYLSTRAPRTNEFNRTWVALDRYRRSLANQGLEIYVISGTAFIALEARLPGILIIGKGRVAVPTHFYQIIALKDVDGAPKTLAFLIPNSSDVNRDFRVYRTTVANIEAVTGLRFFPDLPSDRRTKIVSDLASDLWRLQQAKNNPTP